MIHVIYCGVVSEVYTPRYKRNHVLNKEGYQRSSFSINALRACVYVYTRQLSSFRAPTLWFVDLTVATWHIPNTFWVYAIFFFTRKADKRRKYSKPAILVWYENGGRRLWGSAKSTQFTIHVQFKFIANVPSTRTLSSGPLYWIQLVKGCLSRPFGGPNLLPTAQLPALH